MDNFEIEVTQTITSKLDWDDLVAMGYHCKQMTGKYPQDFEDLLEEVKYSNDFIATPEGKEEEEASKHIEQILEEWNGDPSDIPDQVSFSIAPFVDPVVEMSDKVRYLVDTDKLNQLIWRFVVSILPLTHLSIEREQQEDETVLLVLEGVIEEYEGVKEYVDGGYKEYRERQIVSFIQKMYKEGWQEEFGFKIVPSFTTDTGTHNG